MTTLVDDGVKEFVDALTATRAFQRLKSIRFLGAIDYILVRTPNGARCNIRHTRYEHSIGVAYLAMHYAAHVGLDRATRKLVCAVALLHDIGHAPLSHTLEPVFKEAFGIDHHKATEDIIAGRVKIGREVNKVLRNFSVDPDRVTAVLAGDHDPCAGFFGGPINFDTIEGILRTRQYVTRSVSGLTSSRVVVAATDRSGGEDQKAVDEFWQQKNEVYTGIIRSRNGILADYLCQALARRYIWRLSQSDYFLTEVAMFKKLPEIRNALRLGLEDGIEQHDLGRPTKYISRTFYIDPKIDFRDRDDSARYRQSKSVRAFPGSTASRNLPAACEQLDMLTEAQT